ncbi:hypothetical protein ACFY89_09030 [Achromobacter spanius]|uniref:hypothetical protein n=1 Tax=Achromobacter spanius TaxID=217203 RepID=UPI0036EA2E0F
MQTLLAFIVQTLVMGYVRSAPVHAARHCRTSPILRAAIRNSQFVGWVKRGTHPARTPPRIARNPSCSRRRHSHHAAAADIHHAAAADIHRAYVGDGLRAVGTCLRGQTLPHFTHPTNCDPQFAIRNS